VVAIRAAHEKRRRLTCAAISSDIESGMKTQQVGHVLRPAARNLVLIDDDHGSEALVGNLGRARGGDDDFCGFTALGGGRHRNDKGKQSNSGIRGTVDRTLSFILCTPARLFYGRSTGKRESTRVSRTDPVARRDSALPSTQAGLRAREWTFRSWSDTFPYLTVQWYSSALSSPTVAGAASELRHDVARTNFTFHPWALTLGTPEQRLRYSNILKRAKVVIHPDDRNSWRCGVGSASR
jgi:hypothetical protein